jgi:hypothetical protein
MDTFQIRQWIIDSLPMLGFTCVELCGERILLRDGCYVGRAFDFDGVHAVWVPADKHVKFFTDDGAELETIPLPSDVDAPSQAG